MTFSITSIMDKLNNCYDYQNLTRLEFIFVEIRFSRSKILIKLWCRPPNIGYLSEFESALLDLMFVYTHVLLLWAILTLPQYDLRYSTQHFDKNCLHLQHILTFKATHFNT